MQDFGGPVLSPRDPNVRPDLVIFDCDGVLIDSEFIVSRVHAEAMTKLGFTVTQTEILEQFTGLAGPAISAMVVERWGRPLPENYYELTHEIMDAAFEAELRPVEGIPDLLGRLAKPYCVASNTRLPRLHEVLRHTGLDRYMGPNVFSASQVARGKPAPDLFLHAAQTMGVDPGRVLVVEDTPAGISAARAANMRVVGFTAGRHCSARTAERLAAAGADLLAGTAEALERLIG